MAGQPAPAAPSAEAQFTSDVLSPLAFLKGGALALFRQQRGTEQEPFQPERQPGEEYPPDQRSAAEILGQRVALTLVPGPDTANDPLMAASLAFPPGAIVSGGVSAAVREAQPAFRAMRQVARVGGQAAEAASATAFPRSSLAFTRRLNITPQMFQGMEQLAVAPDLMPPPVAGGATRFSVPSTAALIQRMNLHGDSPWQRIADVAARVRFGELKPLMPLVDRVNFRALAEGPVKEGILAHTSITELGSNVAAAFEHELKAIGNLRQEFGLKKIRPAPGEDRIVLATRVKGKAPDVSMAINDIIELGDAAYDFTPKQKQMVDHIRSFLQEMKNLLETEKIPFNEITFLEPGRQYFPRWVTAIDKKAISRGFGGVLQGYKQSFQRTRFYDQQLEGLKNGVDYALPEQSVATYIQSVYKAVAEKRLYDMVKPFAASPQSMVSVAYKQPVADTRVALAQLLQMQRAANRLLRGERLPQQTVVALKRAWPTLGQALDAANQSRDKVAARDLIKAIQTEHPAASQAVRLAQRAYDAQVETQKAIVSLGDRGIEKYGLQHVYGRSFGAKNIFPTEIAKPLQRVIDDRANQWLATMNRVVTGTLMPLQAGLDFSGPFIQGLPALATHPARWATATAYHYRAFFQPGAAGQYFAKHPGLIDELLAHNVPLSSAEFYEGGLLRKVPGVKQVAQGFEQSFDAFGDILRGELWLAQREAAGKYADGLDRLAEFVTKSTGSLSTKGLGISANQREFERGFLFFAPRYTRAYIGLMADIVRGGYAGAAARDALGHLMAAGMGASTLVALAQATNREGFDADKFWEEWTGMLNPASDHFLSVKIGGSNYGVGGVIYSALKHAGRAAVIEARNPGDVFNFDPHDDIKNPLSEGVDFWRGRLSPVGGLSWDLISGHNYIGESTRGLGNVAILFADQLLPFAVSGRVLETPREGWATYPLDVTGMRISPRSPWSQVNDARDVAAQAMFDKRWRAEGAEGLTNEQRREINALPDIAERLAWAEQVTNEQDRDPAGVYQRLDKYQQAQSDLLQKRQERIAAAEEEYRRLRQDKGKLREHYRTIYDEFFSAWDRLGPSPAEALRTQKEPHPLDLALQRYFEAVDVKQFTNQWDEVDWDAVDAAKSRALKNLSPTEQAYVERQRLALKSPLEREYDAAKQYKRPYDEAWKRIVTAPYYAEYKQYLQARDQNAQTGAALAQQKPWLLEVERRVGRVREQMRRSDPKLDRLLVDWGYVSKPITERH